MAQPGREKRCLSKARNIVEHPQWLQWWVQRFGPWRHREIMSMLDGTGIPKAFVIFVHFTSKSETFPRVNSFWYCWLCYLCCYFVQQGLFPVLSMGKNALQCKDQFMDVRWCKPFEIFQASIHRTMSVYAPFSLCWFCFLHLSAFHLVPFIDSRLVQYGVRSPQARISSPGSCC